jgi:hypothetical protein
VGAKGRVVRKECQEKTPVRTAATVLTGVFLYRKSSFTGLFRRPELFYFVPFPVVIRDQFHGGKKQQAPEGAGLEPRCQQGMGFFLPNPTWPRSVLKMVYCPGLIWHISPHRFARQVPAANENKKRK